MRKRKELKNENARKIFAKQNNTNLSDFFSLKSKENIFFFKILPLTIVQIDIKYTCQIISFFQDLSIKVKQPLYY
jgi:hypothetical protein